jgi:hypothetical protein
VLNCGLAWLGLLLVCFAVHRTPSLCRCGGRWQHTPTCLLEGWRSLSIHLTTCNRGSELSRAEGRLVVLAPAAAARRGSVLCGGRRLILSCCKEGPQLEVVFETSVMRRGVDGVKTITIRQVHSYWHWRWLRGVQSVNMYVRFPNVHVPSPPQPPQTDHPLAVELS